MRLFTFFILVLFASLFAGCGGQQEQVYINPKKPGEVIDMEASNYSFKPANIRAQEGETLTLAIRNTSGSEHNITVKNPTGEVIKNVDLPADETTNLSVELPRDGTYPFYCDKPFHDILGMDGEIVVLLRN